MLLNIVTKSQKKSTAKPAAPPLSAERRGKKRPRNSKRKTTEKRKKNPSGGSKAGGGGGPLPSAPLYTPEPQEHERTNGEGHIASSAHEKDKLVVTEQKIVKAHNAKKFARGMFSREVRSFEELKLSQRLCDTLQASLGFSRPTRIQARAIPDILSGADVMFKSKTGSGKTLAFLLPAVHTLQGARERLKRSDGTRCIVVAPTRELALQIHHVLSQLLSAFYWLVSTTLMGGERKKSEKARLRKGAIIVIATPGRLLDHMLTTRAFDVTRTQILVLDEADRLLDLGFEKDLSKILEVLDQRKVSGSAPRQTILTSATLSAMVLKLAELSLNDPRKIGFDGSEEGDDDDLTQNMNGNSLLGAGEQLPDGLHQHYIKVDSRYRLTVLATFLRSVLTRRKGRKIIVFFSTCDAVEFHYRLFRHTSWPPNASVGGGDGAVERTPFVDATMHKLHGNIAQKDRTRTFFRFCNASEGILYCTDVAARGLDLPAVDYIIQYDPPDDTNTYIHRVGRTARMGQKGQAVVFLQRSEMEYVQVLESKGLGLSEIGVVAILAELNEDVEEEARGRAADGGDADDDDDGDDKLPPGQHLQNQFEALVMSDIELHEMARLSFLSGIRAYAAYPKSMKSIFHPKKLHLGHVAKSFGLREPPKRLARDMHPNNDRAATAKGGNSKNSFKSKRQKKGGEEAMSVQEKKMAARSKFRNPINRKKQQRMYGDEMRANAKQKARANRKNKQGGSFAQRTKGMPGGSRRANGGRTTSAPRGSKFGAVDSLSEFAC